MCHQNSCPSVTVEEEAAAEECLLVYCKPVELYNILQRRSQQNPSFLSRCLNFKIKANGKTGFVDGNVIFNYRDRNNSIRKTEVTKQFSCPFCLMKCGSFKGLGCHLVSSHDLFKCEFWATEEYRAINVSVKVDALLSEDYAGGVETHLQAFGFCSRPRKRKRQEDPLLKGEYVHPHELETPLPALLIDNNNEGERDSSTCPVSNNPRIGDGCYSHENGDANGVDHVAANSNPGLPVARAQSLEDIDCIQSSPADKNMSLMLPPAAKSRKISSESKSITLLQKRQFYHSHRAQPMDLEQVLSDRDSEDEVDDDIAALEDRRMLDDFVDVSKCEKHLMHLWNSFVKKQRVIADGHVPWACEAFVRLHGKSLIQTPPLLWCWRLFMVKLWNHGLLEACSMNNCSVILEELRSESPTKKAPTDDKSEPKAPADDKSEPKAPADDKSEPKE